MDGADGIVSESGQPGSLEGTDAAVDEEIENNAGEGGGE